MLRREPFRDKRRFKSRGNLYDSRVFLIQCRAARMLCVRNAKPLARVSRYRCGDPEFSQQDVDVR